MKAVVGSLFVLLLLESAQTDMAGECEMASFYLELGCTPAPDEVEDSSARSSGVKCPQAFVCPDLHPNAGMCYYRGVAYEDRSTVPQTQIKNPCSQVCACRVYAGVPGFECAAVDCVEVFDGRTKEECVMTYELDSCCSVGNVCGKDAVAKLKACEIEGKTYKEGQLFTPKNTMKNCICTEKWNGSTENPEYCQDINCGIEIHYQDKLYGKCAPVFANNVFSCPINFQCPTADMKIVKGLNMRGLNAQCVFGNQTLSVGDAVDLSDCMRCHCNVPPFLNCGKQPASKCH